ncbi:MAG: hypothetical protein QCH96_05165 [Candidatus Thermoplasmatota archaeon]|nr:hypothetical protein [Candidatus Thermoplasmatota archaeon]
MNKNNMLLLLIIAIVVILVSIFGYYQLTQVDEKDDEPEVLEPTISLAPLMNKTYRQLLQSGLLDGLEIVDDRISPLTNQAVSLEITRIRKKGIDDQMRVIGNAWKKQPVYYFEAVIDDGEWKSHEINTWDTGYVGWEAFRDVNDELEECTIEVKIYEIQKNFFKTQSIEKESFSLVYCLRTGRWTGDNRLEGGLPGTGYLNGENYEIWFDVHQSDYDGDGIPYWMEVNILGTDPTVDDRYQDADLDGLPTAWEWKWGFCPLTWDNHAAIDISNDGLSNIDKYNLAKWGANPYRQDIYVEVDFMEKAPGLFSKDHVFHEESKQMVMDKFAEQGITLHVDDGCMGGGGEFLKYHEEYISQEGGIGSEYYKYHFADDRKGVFRYGIIVHSAGWAHPQNYKLQYDVISVPDNKNFYKNVFFPIPAVTARLQRIAMACAFMHELGHTLGLRGETNPGIDNTTQIGRGMEDVPFFQSMKLQREARAYWSNYKSVMNYDQFGKYVLGYSDGTNGENDVDDWSMIDLTYFKTHEPDGVEGIP